MNVKVYFATLIEVLMTANLLVEAIKHGIDEGSMS